MFVSKFVVWVCFTASPAVVCSAVHLEAEYPYIFLCTQPVFWGSYCTKSVHVQSDSFLHLANSFRSCCCHTQSCLLKWFNLELDDTALFSFSVRIIMTLFVYDHVVNCSIYRCTLCAHVPLFKFFTHTCFATHCFQTRNWACSPCSKLGCYFLSSFEFH